MGDPGDVATSAYAERVYAGVLGKIIGVYLGRPVEGWSYEAIRDRFGFVDRFVHDDLGQRVVVPDDDITGTFTFPRALEDNGFPADLSPRLIGETWLNYIIEERAILWWGGTGHSTEHTAYLNLKRGIPAPESGSIARNGKVTAEQIGAQIFVDGWGMVCPGDVAAAVLAARAASVSHDGAAIHAAQVIAALVAGAFVESDLDRLLDRAVATIPPDSTIARVIADVRGWAATDAGDWRRTRDRIAATYTARRYPGNVHVVPNHAVIVMALLHGDGDLRRNIAIATSAGWDTDCNAGNVGAVLGVRGGLAGLESVADLRAIVNDRLFLPTADGARAVTDAVREADAIVRAACARRGQVMAGPKGGARFHWSWSGATQGVTAANGTIANVAAGEGRRLRVERPLGADASTVVTTPAFLRPEENVDAGYAMLASPALVAGQTLRARVVNTGSLVLRVSLLVRAYDPDDALVDSRGPARDIAPDEAVTLSWPVDPDADGPISETGISIDGPAGQLDIDWMTWDGSPKTVLRPTPGNGSMWAAAWVNGVDQVHGTFWGASYLLSQNEGTGLFISGTREWRDYKVTMRFEPRTVQRIGVAARVQGMRRYLAFVLSRDGYARLIRAWDGVDHVLAAVRFPCPDHVEIELSLTVDGDQVTGWVDWCPLLRATDERLASGGIAVVLTEGTVALVEARVNPP